MKSARAACSVTHIEGKLYHTPVGKIRPRALKFVVVGDVGLMRTKTPDTGSGNIGSNPIHPTAKIKRVT